MNKFAPEIKRQRLLIEGYYNDIDINESVIKDYFSTIANNLDL